MGGAHGRSGGGTADLHADEYLFRGGCCSVTMARISVAASAVYGVEQRPYVAHGPLQARLAVWRLVRINTIVADLLDRFTDGRVRHRSVPASLGDVDEFICRAVGVAGVDAAGEDVRGYWASTTGRARWTSARRARTTTATRRPGENDSDLKQLTLIRTRANCGRAAGGHRPAAGHRPPSRVAAGGQ